MPLNEKCQILTFKLANHQMAFKTSDISAVTRLLEITSVARTIDFFEGIINLRGELTPVINLRALLHFPKKENDMQTCLVAVKGDGFTFCVTVDQMPTMMTIETKGLEPPPSILFDRYIESVYKADENLTLIFNAKALVDPYELKGIMMEKESEKYLTVE